jgi:hypothetical protein
VAEVSMLVAVLVTVTEAFGTAAPLASRIVPTRLPTSNCAYARQFAKQSDTAKRVRIISLIGVLIDPDDMNFLETDV